MRRYFRRGFTLSELLGVIPIIAVLIGIIVASAAFIPDDRGTGEVPRASEERISPVLIKVRGIENVFRLGPRLYSGGQPDGPESFAALKELGIKTIVSVDGAMPDVEAARKLGLRYVHLPVGYDGIPREQAVRIVKAARTLPGPVFVHCHHGKHRGPAAAALCGMATEGWSKGDAAAWMKRAGTAPDYRGLFATVADFVTPSDAELARVGDGFPERAETPALVELMVAIDGQWDRLKAVRAAGFKAPSHHPDIDPPHEALQLVEQFQELARHAAAKGKGEDFVKKAEASARIVSGLEAALRQSSKSPTEEAREKFEDAFVAVGKSCSGCHAHYRDN
jgi:protein tyrosine phosphatase (PTP) superfamily phosphohydrolase (DUF442 family)